MLTEAEKKEALKWIKEGRDRSIVADLMGVSLHKLLVELGIRDAVEVPEEKQRKYRDFKMFDKNEIAKEWNSGVHSSVLMEKYGFDSVADVSKFASNCRNDGYKFEHRIGNSKDLMCIDWNNDVSNEILVKRYGYKDYDSLRHCVIYLRKKGYPFKIKMNHGVRTNNSPETRGSYRRKEKV